MKYHPHNSTLFVTFSIQQGLLLLSNPLCKAMVKSCLARAQSKYPVRISAFVIEATHVHLVLVVDNPDDVPSFMRHFKTESAHALNRILGRKKRTIWCDGYDSPVVLTPARTIIALAYLYSNPAKDDLEETIDRYPGVSSWRMFLRGEHRKTWKGFQRSDFERLAPDAHNLQGYTRAARRLQAMKKQDYEFVLEPNAWMEAFGITSEEQQARYNKILVERVRTLEKRARRKRENRGKKVMGTQRLLNQRLNTTWLPSRTGKRTWCLSDNRRLRARFIVFLKGLFAKARAVRARWRLGDYSVPYPMGLYPPSPPKLVEPLTAW